MGHGPVYLTGCDSRILTMLFFLASFIWPGGEWVLPRERTEEVFLLRDVLRTLGAVVSEERPV